MKTCTFTSSLFPFYSIQSFIRSFVHSFIRSFVHSYLAQLIFITGEILSRLPNILTITTFHYSVFTFPWTFSIPFSSKLLPINWMISEVLIFNIFCESWHCFRHREGIHSLVFAGECKWKNKEWMNEWISINIIGTYR